jgi:hypothetical protein
MSTVSLGRRRDRRHEVVERFALEMCALRVVMAASVADVGAPAAVTDRHPWPTPCNAQIAMHVDDRAQPSPQSNWDLLRPSAWTRTCPTTGGRVRPSTVVSSWLGVMAASLRAGLRAPSRALYGPLLRLLPAMADMPQHTRLAKPRVSDKPCPRCGQLQVSLFLRTDYALYLRCDDCDHRWNELHQRQAPPAV